MFHHTNAFELDNLDRARSRCPLLRADDATTVDAASCALSGALERVNTLARALSIFVSAASDGGSYNACTV
jgi:cytidylate kinase